MGTGMQEIAQGSPTSEPLTTVASGCLEEIQTCHNHVDVLMKNVFGRNPRDAAEEMKLASMENVIHEIRAQAGQLRVRLDDFITSLAG